MPRVTIRDLQRNPSQIVRALEASGQPVFVTRNGRPVAVLTPFDEEAFDDYVLSQSPVIGAALRRADRDLEDGYTKGWDEVREDLGADEPGGAEHRRRRPAAS